MGKLRVCAVKRELRARFECSASPIAATLSAREIDKRSAEYAAKQFGGGTPLQIEAELHRGASVEYVAET